MPSLDNDDTILVIGAGIGGLAAALRLATAGRDVLVLERAGGPGGKLRTMPSSVGPVDAGPTVMTLLPIFEALFAEAGETLSDHLELTRESLVARHWWPDGASLDLFADADSNAAAIRVFAGSTAESEFRNFQRITQRLFTAFETPVMQSPKPNLLGILSACMQNPDVLKMLLPGRTLWSMLDGHFTDKRLAQLFGRYATYVGGSPFFSPALLSLIWQAEAAGVWTIKGGMSKLAEAIEQVAIRSGASFEYGSGVREIRRLQSGKFEVIRDDGQCQIVRNILFNGDPAALHKGLLGHTMRAAVKRSGVKDRSLSAWVWSFAAKPEGRDLAHHNVFFNADYRREFDAIATNSMPDDAALYVCAQDRSQDVAPNGTERFEIILNAPAIEPGQAHAAEEYSQCLTQTFQTLSAHGLDFTPLPDRRSLTTPQDFATRFHGSAGSLYGRSPHGMMASFQRPTVRSRIPGLYLAGGGVHPGAGLPMAATSGRLAAEAILMDLASISMSRRTVTRGGISTAYPTTAPAVSRSSVS